MKKYLLIFIIACSPILSIAQAYQGSIEFDKKKQQAFIIDYSYPPEAVENAILQKNGEYGI